MRLSLRPTAARRGFTLVELMIVVGIVILLVAMATAAIMKFRDTGPYIATQMNLSKIKSAFDTQWKAVRDLVQKEPIDSTLAGRLVSGATTGANLKVREQYIARRMKALFPMTIPEALNPNGDIDTTGYPLLKAYKPYESYLTNPPANNGLGINASNVSNIPLDVQQAVCLQMIVQRGQFNSALAPDVLGTSGSLKLDLKFKVSGNDIFAFGCVDAWSRALLFTRRYNGIDYKPAIVSAGADGKSGVNLSLLSNPDNFTLAITNAVEAEDNLLSVNP